MAQTIVVLKRAHFFSLDNDLIDVHAQTIGALGIAVYAVLARYANRKTGECWPAIARIERVLGLARSTVKVYLRKLEAAGLIAITARRDVAGDPTSHLYVLLDPSPVAVAQRRATRTAPAPDDEAPPAPLSEGGRPSAAPPPVASHPGGRPSATPKPSPLNPTQENQDAPSGADENPHTPDHNDSHQMDDHPFDVDETPVPSNRPPCPHPAPEVSHFGAIAVCRHCWTLLDLTAPPPSAPAHDRHEEGATTSRAA